MKRWRQALVALLFCACSAPVLAGPLIFDSGTTVDAGWPAMGESPLTVDAFRLDPGSSTIAGLRWSGLYSGESVPAVETFLIRIFADAGGSPGTSPALHSLQVSPARVDTGIDLPLFDPIPRNLLEYSADLTPLALAPDTLYWLSISLLSASPDNWFWGGEVGPGGVQFGSSEQWFPLNIAMDFQLLGPAVNVDGSAVPLPGTLALIGLGLVGAWVSRRRRAGEA